MKPHGIMFHHFWNGNHPKGQGAISGDKLEKMLHFIGLKNILSAQEFQKRAISKTLKKEDICLTFDDNLRCQFDVAYPILKKYKLTAFWFIYTSPFLGVNERLEIYRYYRTVAFDSIDEFYNCFFSYVRKSKYKNLVDKGLAGFSPGRYLSEFSFYSESDKKFRFVRDRILKERYPALMDDIINSDRNFSVSGIRKRLWMDGSCIKKLDTGGHVIGLHSHTHPMDLGELPYRKQKIEYTKNYDIIRQMLKKKPLCVSYPCGSYNEDTLKIMDNLGILAGFAATMNFNAGDSLTLPRKDHADVLREMES